MSHENNETLAIFWSFLEAISQTRNELLNYSIKLFCIERNIDKNTELIKSLVK